MICFYQILNGDDIVTFKYNDDVYDPAMSAEDVKDYMHKYGDFADRLGLDPMHLSSAIMMAKYEDNSFSLTKKHFKSIVGEDEAKQVEAILKEMGYSNLKVIVDNDKN